MTAGDSNNKSPSPGARPFKDWQEEDTLKPDLKEVAAEANLADSDTEEISSFKSGAESSGSSTLASQPSSSKSSSSKSSASSSAFKPSPSKSGSSKSGSSKSKSSKSSAPAPVAKRKRYDAEGYDISEVDWDYEGYDDSDEHVQNLFVGDRRFELGKVNMAAFWTLTVLSILLANAPGVSTVLTPVNQFVTMIHESCHALVALLTGGQPSVTIVDDGMGHSGLTQINGGWLFLSLQAGYLGTAFFGCFLIFLGQFHKYSHYILMAIGSMIILSSLIFITPSIFSFTTWWSGLLSMAWGLAMGFALVIMGLKLKPIWANLVLLFLAVQTALSSITLVWFLLPHSLGLAGRGFSDATVMQQNFLIPAPFWAVSWIILSIGMLLITLRFTFGRAVISKIKIKKRELIEEDDDDEEEDDNK